MFISALVLTPRKRLIICIMAYLQEEKFPCLCRICSGVPIMEISLISSASGGWLITLILKNNLICKRSIFPPALTPRKKRSGKHFGRMKAIGIGPVLLPKGPMLKQTAGKREPRFCFLMEKEAEW